MMMTTRSAVIIALAANSKCLACVHKQLLTSPDIQTIVFCTLQRAGSPLNRAPAPTCVFAALGAPTGADPKRDTTASKGGGGNGYNSK
jgi:hypothetical protein